jgi:hypothetical protein
MLVRAVDEILGTHRKPGALSAARPRPAAPGTGWTGAAATKPGHAGTTSEQDSPAMRQLS